MKTSRSESRNLDNLGVDIAGTQPINFQCKCTQNNPKYDEILGAMPEGINVILHKKVKKTKSRFMPAGEFAILGLDDYIDLLKFAMEHGYLDKHK